MKPAAFDYVRAVDLAHAQAVLATHAEDARILAGGQSLVPLLNMRLAAPKVIVDINRVPGLAAIETTAGAVSIGALARHADVQSSPVAAAHAPLLSLALAHVAHAGVRNRGTMGGSLALADPAAELPACALALGAQLVLSSSVGGERTVTAEKFFRGLYETALRPEEMLLRAVFPAARPGQRFALQEVARRQGDYAILGLAAAATVRDGILSDTVLCFFGTGDRPTLAPTAAACLDGRPLQRIDAADAIAAVATDVEFTGDPQSSAALRRHLSGVLIERALAQMASSPDGGSTG